MDKKHWAEHPAKKCPKCNKGMEFEECAACGGDGVYDNPDFDPDVDDGEEPENECEECDGEGAFYICSDRKCGNVVFLRD